MNQLTKQRNVQFWVGNDTLLSCQLAKLPKTKSAVWIGDNLPPFLSFLHFPFSKSKNLLGQAFSLIIYDGRDGLNLDALAIASGTLEEQGTLLILFEQWETLTQWQDPDSLRWAGEEQSILTPHFIGYFQQKVQDYAFPIYYANFPAIQLPCEAKSALSLSRDPTAEQEKCLQAIATSTAEILIVTAKRGRGKSALAGLWAKQLLQQNQSLVLTAPNKNAVKVLHYFAESTLNFMPPDVLCEQINQDPTQFADSWLLIDEAAMIPLRLLVQLTSAFKRVLCTTTIQSYEGTGRGFLLKFMANLSRSFIQFELHQPLRWQENDLLEAFIDDLLLLDAEEVILQQTRHLHTIEFRRYSQLALVETQKIAGFYGLLTLAHYRTSPLDLRRLFDAPKQQFYLAETTSQLIGGVWLVEEGNMQSDRLIVDIARGLRRPRGNLVVQALCYQANWQEACRLSSLRISRIAIQPNWQRQSIGLQLITKISQQANVDFLSVSFGYSVELAEFWQKCGFYVVHLGEQKEASSGCYSTIAIKPLSERGHQFCLQVQQQFLRNIGFSSHPLRNVFASSRLDWFLSAQDLQVLTHFAYFHTPFSGAIAPIFRLIKQVGKEDCPVLAAFLQDSESVISKVGGKQTWLKICRHEVKKMLQKYTILL